MTARRQFPPQEVSYDLAFSTQYSLSTDQTNILARLQDATNTTGGDTSDKFIRAESRRSAQTPASRHAAEKQTTLLDVRALALITIM